jgi:hypothetical protein
MASARTWTASNTSVPARRLKLKHSRVKLTEEITIKELDDELEEYKKMGWQENDDNKTEQ